MNPDANARRKRDAALFGAAVLSVSGGVFWGALSAWVMMVNDELQSPGQPGDDMPSGLRAGPSTPCSAG